MCLSQVRPAQHPCVQSVRCGGGCATKGLGKQAAAAAEGRAPPPPSSPASPQTHQPLAPTPSRAQLHHRPDDEPVFLRRLRLAPSHTGRRRGAARADARALRLPRQGALPLWCGPAGTGSVWCVTSAEADWEGGVAGRCWLHPLTLTASFLALSSGAGVERVLRFGGGPGGATAGGAGTRAAPARRSRPLPRALLPARNAPAASCCRRLNAGRRGGGRRRRDCGPGRTDWRGGCGRWQRCGMMQS